MWASIPVEINSSMHRAKTRESVLNHFQKDISDAAMWAQGPIYEASYTVDLSVGKEDGRTFPGIPYPRKMTVDLSLPYPATVSGARNDVRHFPRNTSRPSEGRPASWMSAAAMTSSGISHCPRMPGGLSTTAPWKSEPGSFSLRDTMD